LFASTRAAARWFGARRVACGLAQRAFAAHRAARSFSTFVSPQLPANARETHGARVDDDSSMPRVQRTLRSS